MMDDDEDELRSTPSFRYRWDVFLSFRGEDTRHGFTDRLYRQLTLNGVRTFRDDEELERGEEINPSLGEAIEDSAATIAVISRRKQKGPFEQDFLNLEERFGVEKVARWRSAMEKAGGISGWDSRIWDEEELIQSLVKKVLNKLSNTPLGAAKYPVGLDCQLEELMRMLDVKANGVRVLGFYGMGGVGKTTLSKALYNKLVIHFKRRSFISNIRETWRHHNGLMDLQNKIIHDLSANEAEHVDEGSLGDPGQWSRLWDRDKILTVLKNEKGTRNIQGIALDIEKKEHELSAEQRYWINFKMKPTFTSAITYLKEIIYKNFFQHLTDNGTGVMLHTNSFKPLVNLRLLQIDHVKLNGSFRVMPAELKWLQWRGCSLKTLPFEFSSQHIAVLDLSKSKITKVWGWRWWNLFFENKIMGRLLVMNLCDCFHLTEIPDLSDHSFLEKLILENCRELVKIHKSIVKLPDSIFRLRKLEKFSLKNCRSLKRLPDCIGKLSSLKELSLDSSALEELPYSIGSLAELEKLNLMRCKSLTAIPDSIGNLKSLEELLFDSSSINELPASVGSLFRLKYLSLGYCRSLSKLPDSIEGLASLVKLRLEGMLITEVPVQIGTLNLVKKLEMGNCQLLKYLPQSIGKMLSITTLVLDDARITELPESIGMLERLIVLKLNKCKQLQRLPSSIGNLKSLQYLLMSETSVTDLPDEFGMLSSLIVLKMRKEPHTGSRQDTVEHSDPTNSNAQDGQLIVLPRSFSNLSSLKELDAHAWKLSGMISDEFEKLSSLEVLNLSRNNFCSLPSSLRGLSLLKDLALSHCRELKSLPPFPSSLLKLDVANCSALESISDLSNLESLHYLNLTNCTKIMDIPGLQCLKSMRRLYLSGCNASFPVVKRRLAKVALKYLRNLSVPGSEIPNWFVQEIPCFASHKNRDIKGIIIGVVVSLDQSTHDAFRDKLPAIVDIQAKILRLDDPIFTTTLYLMGVPETDEDQLYLCRYVDFSPLVLLLQDGDKIQIATRERPYFHGLKLKKYGIHLVFENDDDIDDNDDEESLDESQQSVSVKLAKFIGSL
ncbi:hypothetical protein Q3G72_031426 [Acer saccharum]|nr:hypothetical protein Q3G72_031426 [Acer saccharum]